MKKRLAFVVAIVMLISLMPSFALAASGTITADGTYDIGDYGIDSIITIDSLSSTDGLTVTLTNTTGNTFTNLQIDCKDAATLLTIVDIEINNAATDDTCALAFTGSGNTLTLIGDSVLTSGENEPGVRVEDSTSLTIDSIVNGTVTVTGGYQAAGIGGGYSGDGGYIYILGGMVTATGGQYGAGIGGGNGGAGGSIDISGGTVTAVGDYYGAGIGSGYNGGGGTINISAGVVMATNENYGAGIGGGRGGAGGIINISGGIVTAVSDYSGTGIGGGFGAAGGDINISGGEVYAEGHIANGAQDIGMSASGSEGTFTISGVAAVFMKNDAYTIPTTTTHTHEVISTVDGDQVYGVSANGWTPTFGVYMRLHTLDYSTNDGIGSVPDSVTQHIGTTETVGDNRGLTRDGYELGDWNTQSDGYGDTYELGDTLTLLDDVTLFAEWSVVESIDPSYTIVIPAAVDLGTMEIGSGTISQEFPIEAQNVVLEDGYRIRVGVTSDFVLKDKDGTGEISLVYSLENSGATVMTSGLTFTLFTGNRTETGEIRVNTNSILKAGSYKGVMVFTIVYEEV